MIGCGDVAIRVAAQLGDDFQCIGVRRHIAALPASIKGISCDLNNGLPREALPPRIDYVIITLVPGERSENGYRQAYGDNLRGIIATLMSLSSRPKRVFFVSSTSVYGQSSGDWVDETSETLPGSYAGEHVLAGERRVLSSGLPTTVVRFSGIYGPGRTRLITQVRDGDRRGNGYSNRIHADDAAAVLSYLLERDNSDDKLDTLYLATDCEPVMLREVKTWLAEQMALPSEANTCDKTRHVPAGDYQRGNKRCSNAKLLAEGFQYRYPTFREGYRQVLAEGGLI